MNEKEFCEIADWGIEFLPSVSTKKMVVFSVVFEKATVSLNLLLPLYLHHRPDKCTGPAQAATCRRVVSVELPPL